jgi:acyl-CoA hydrolase
MYDEIREKALSGIFTLVAIGEKKKQVKIFENDNI